MTISAQPRAIRVLLALLPVLSIAFLSRAQIVLTPSTGCAPLAVQFSGPAGATNISWNLGVGTTTLANPSHIYQAGTYYIFYSAMVGGNPVSYSTTLVVSNPPSGNFSFAMPASHCLPMTVTLTGSGGSPGSTFSWAFGDLTALGSGSSVTHTYSIKGSFVPVLTIVDAVTGCTAIATNQSGAVHVSAPPVLSITANPGLSVCSPTYAASFSGSTSVSGSPLTGPLTGWTWSFGGGTPSSGTGMNTGIVTFGTGQHTVSLSATDNNQCASSTQVIVSVTSVTLNLPAHNVYCLGEVVLMNFTSSEPESWWIEPGGTPTLMTSAPSLTLSTPGLNIFTVTVNPPFPCATTTKTFSAFVEVIQPLLSWSQPSTSCNGTLVMSYTGAAISNTTSSFSYTFRPDGGTTYNTAGPPEVIGNPATFTIHQNYSSNPYTVYRPWFPRIKMLIENSVTGCVIDFNYDKTAVVQRPTAWFYTDVRDGCGPLTVKFRDSAQTWLPQYPIAGYTLHTGVPSVSISGTGTMSPYVYTYNAPGTYSAWMIVKTSSLTNCIDTSFFHDIHVGQPPTPSLALSTSVVCAGMPVQVTLTTVPSLTAPPHWHVHSDNAFFSHCISDSTPSWPFTHTGTHGFTVSAYDEGCEGKQASTVSVTVKGPYAGIRVRGTCAPGQRNSVVISSRLEEVSTATLHFGDNTSLAIAGNAGGIASHSVAHTYSASGDYTAVLVTENNSSGCASRSFSVPVIIRDAQARITRQGSSLPSLPAGIGCVKNTFTFSAVTSTDVMVACERGYLWSLSHPIFTYQIVDGESPVFTSTVLEYPGVYNLTLRVKDINGCEDTNTVQFRLSGGSADFSITANPLCFSTGTVQFLNNSLDSLHIFDHIDTAKWDFGDGTVYIPADPMENPVHQYLYAPNPFIVFPVSLITVNNLGCPDTLKQTIQVNNPFPDLQVTNDHPCIPQGGVRSVTMTAGSGYATYSVNTGIPGAGWNVLTQPSLSVTYYTTGVFATSLVVVDAGNCRAEQVATITAIGQPTAVLSLGENRNKFCLPGTPTLISVSKYYNTPITNTLWTIGQVTTPPPGTGTFVNQIFTSTGVFTIGLTVNVDGYCPSHTLTQIVVADPHAKFNLNKVKFCLGDTISVGLADTSDVLGWQWFFGDFSPQPVILAKSAFAKLYPILSYPYTIFPPDSAGRTQLILQYFGTDGACPRTETKDLTVIQLNSTFGTDDGLYRHCLKEVDQFTVVTIDRWNLSIAYTWNFGDGHAATGSPVQHLYTIPGVYKVLMTARDSEFGCRDTMSRSMTVLPLPGGTISATPADLCPGDSVTLTGRGAPGVSGAVTGSINPVGSVSFNAANEFTIGTVAHQSTSYVLEVIDSNQCRSELVYASVKVVQPHPQKFWDTTIVIGQTVMLNANTGSNYSYSWTPVFTDLSCVTCYSPVSSSTNEITYTVQVTDHPLQCYTLPSVFRIRINPLVTLDVPTAFTPNGDGVNDHIYPDGWGIKRLLYFRVYNRWGQLIYESRELRPGWDGTYLGVAQNTETYAYQVAVESLTGTTLTKTGTFKLLR